MVVKCNVVFLQIPSKSFTQCYVYLMPIRILQHNWKLVSSHGQVTADVATRLKPAFLFVFCFSFRQEKVI